MARFDYARMQGTASRLLERFNQGTVTITRVTQTTPNSAEPWNKSETTATYTLAATVRRVEETYIDGTLIVGTEDQVTFAVPSIVPAMADRFAVDGVTRKVKKLFSIPAAGTPVAYVAIVES